MSYLFMFVYIVMLVLIMVLETYSIYEYRTCSNYDNRPYYNDCVFICDRDSLLSDFDYFYDYKPITLRDLEYILNS
jgi:hypothetical protein